MTICTDETMIKMLSEALARLDAECATLKMELRRKGHCGARSRRDGIICESYYGHDGHHSSNGSAIRWPDTERVPGDRAMERIDKLAFSGGSETLNQLTTLKEKVVALTSENDELKTKLNEARDTLSFTVDESRLHMSDVCVHVLRLDSTLQKAVMRIGACFASQELMAAMRQTTELRKMVEDDRPICQSCKHPTAHHDSLGQCAVHDALGDCGCTMTAAMKIDDTKDRLSREKK